MLVRLIEATTKEVMVMSVAEEVSLLTVVA